jgi:hypothetical protein
LIAFQRYLQNSENINIALFFDGLNDIFHNCPTVRNRSRFSESIANYWDEMDYLANPFGRRSGNIFKKILSRLPLITFLKKLENKISCELKKKDLKSMDRFDEPWSKGKSLEKVNVKQLAEEVSELTHTNWNLARGISEKFNIKPILMTQPTYYLNMDLDKHLFTIKNENPFWFDLYKEYYAKLIEKNKSSADFLDGSALFSHVTESPFIDSHHYSPYGNQIIADAIAQEILEKE